MNSLAAFREEANRAFTPFEAQLSPLQAPQRGWEMYDLLARGLGSCGASSHPLAPREDQAVWGFSGVALQGAKNRGTSEREKRLKETKTMTTVEPKKRYRGS